MSSAGFPNHPSLLQDASLSDLETAWRERQVEAEVLEREGHHSTAIALRVYSLEIRLKTLICKTLKLNSLPKACKTHDLSELIIFTGLWGEMNETSYFAVRQNWDLLVAYSKKSLNDSRYQPRSGFSVAENANLISALDDSTDGVTAWLSRHP
jgi:hypothetical protein